MLLPVGTTGQRPAGVAGMIRYNGTTPGVEAFYSGAWNPLNSGTVTSIATNNGITGGTIVGSGTIGLAPIGTSQILANPTNASAVPVGTSLSSLLDAALSATQGSIIYRDASAWMALAPGTSGQVLQSGGSSANPSWATPTVGFSSCTIVSSSASGGADATASCAAGYTMTGGGCNPLGVHVVVDVPASTGYGSTYSYPSSSSSWTCEANNINPTAYAICCH